MTFKRPTLFVSVIACCNMHGHLIQMWTVKLTVANDALLFILLEFVKAIVNTLKKKTKRKCVNPWMNAETCQIQLYQEWWWESKAYQIGNSWKWSQLDWMLDIENKNAYSDMFNVSVGFFFTFLFPDSIPTNGIHYGTKENGALKSTYLIFNLVCLLYQQ